MRVMTRVLNVEAQGSGTEVVAITPLMRLNIADIRLVASLWRATGRTFSCIMNFDYEVNVPELFHCNNNHEA